MVRGHQLSGSLAFTLKASACTNMISSQHEADNINALQAATSFHSAEQPLTLIRNVIKAGAKIMKAVNNSRIVL